MSATVMCDADGRRGRFAVSGFSTFAYLYFRVPRRAAAGDVGTFARAKVASLVFTLFTGRRREGEAEGG